MSRIEEIRAAMYQPGIDGNTGKMMRRVAILSDAIRDRDAEITRLSSGLNEAKAQGMDESVQILLDNEEAGRTAKLIIIARAAALRSEVKP